MKDTDITEIIHLNNRLLLLLGMGASIISDCRNERPRSDHHKFDWFMDALTEVVYKNNPIPPFPDEA